MGTALGVNLQLIISVPNITGLRAAPATRGGASLGGRSKGVRQTGREVQRLTSALPAAAVPRGAGGVPSPGSPSAPARPGGSAAAAVPGWRDEPPRDAILTVLGEGFLRGKGTRSPAPGPGGGCWGARRGARPRRTSVRVLSSSCASPGRAGAADSSGAAGEEASPGPGPGPPPRCRAPAPPPHRYR